MRHDDDRQAGLPYALTHDLGERRESGADHRSGRDTEIFESGRVTRGPGGRGASVTDAVDHGVAPPCHFLREGRRDAEVALAPEADDFDAVIAPQRFGYAFEQQVGEFLVIVEYADARAAQRFEARTHPPRRDICFAGRNVHRDTADGCFTCACHDLRPRNAERRGPWVPILTIPGITNNELIVMVHNGWLYSNPAQPQANHYEHPRA